MEQKLLNFGRVRGLVIGAWGEISEDLKNMMQIMADKKQEELKAEFLKRTDTQTHVRAKKILESAQNLDFGTQNCQNRHFFIFLLQFDSIFQIFLVFMAILVHNSAQKVNKQNSDRAK